MFGTPVLRGEMKREDWSNKEEGDASFFFSSEWRFATTKQSE